MVTVPKPTQVGEMNILRRARERSLRNSANYPRNFGKRGAKGCERRNTSSELWQHKNGPGDCLTKTQHYAKSFKTQYMV